MLLTSSKVNQKPRCKHRGIKPFTDQISKNDSPKIKKNTLVSISLITEDEGGNLLDESEEVMYLHGDYGQIFRKLED